MKKGRAVAAILFSIERTVVQIQMPLDDIEILEAGEELALLPKDILVLVLIEKGVAKRKARELVDTYDEERIRENIAYAEKEYQAGKVKNLTAYLIRGIEQDYRPRKTPEECRREQETAKKKEHRKERQALDELTREWKRYRAQRVRERFNALLPNEQEELRQVFIDNLQRTDSLLYSRYKKQGFRSRLVEAQFFSSLSDILLVDPSETSFDAYRASPSR